MGRFDINQGLTGASNTCGNSNVLGNTAQLNAKPNAKHYLGVRLILNGLKTNIFEESMASKTPPTPTHPNQNNQMT